MVTVRFEEAAGYLAMTMDGHATGSDRVCAAASALACALAGWLEWYGAEASWEPELELGPGRSRIRCRDTEQAREGFEVVAVGMAMLAREHPDHVEILGKSTGVFPAGMW